MDHFNPRPINRDEFHIVDRAPPSHFERGIKDAVLNVFGNNTSNNNFSLIRTYDEMQGQNSTTHNHHQRQELLAFPPASFSTRSMANTPAAVSGTASSSSLTSQSSTHEEEEVTFDLSKERSLAPKKTAPNSCSFGSTNVQPKDTKKKQKFSHSASANSFSSSSSDSSMEHVFQHSNVPAAIVPEYNTSNISFPAAAGAAISQEATTESYYNPYAQAGGGGGATCSNNMKGTSTSTSIVPEYNTSNMFFPAAARAAMSQEATTESYYPPYAQAGGGGGATSPTNMKGTSTSTTTASFGTCQASKWNARYQELVEYKHEFGNCNVSSDWAPNQGLSQWCKRQRHQYRQRKEGHHSTLTQERQDELDRLGFIWDVHDAVWEERLSELHQFRQRHGHCKIPTAYPQSPGLAIWAKCQRRHFKMFCTQKSKGEGWTSNTMTEERILKLAKAGFIFSNRSSKGALEILTDCANGRFNVDEEL